MERQLTRCINVVKFIHLTEENQTEYKYGARNEIHRMSNPTVNTCMLNITSVLAQSPWSCQEIWINLKRSMTMKKSAFEEMCDTCFSKVLPFLVNIHNDINYPIGEFILHLQGVQSIQILVFLESFYEVWYLTLLKKTSQYNLKSQRSAHISF